MPLNLSIHGSNARDFAMLERNLLTHLRFATVLALFAASMLLNARLPFDPGLSGQTQSTRSNVPLASIQVVAAIVTITLGLWVYHRAFKDVCGMKAFLSTTKPQLVVMSLISVAVFVTCIVLLSTEH
ncbi:unnamed protein product [Somion occarium]|uniref:DUF202 domain-containing protein n=1 Tax=Somion occarium TaxID=3059160 RepID=A0ABP1E5V9_9APHY